MVVMDGPQMLRDEPVTCCHVKHSLPGRHVAFPLLRKTRTLVCTANRWRGHGDGRQQHGVNEKGEGTHRARHGDVWGVKDAACLKDDEANALCNKVDLNYGEDTLRTKAPDYRNSFRLFMVLTRRPL